jgi:hypothetical protein
MQLQQQAGVVPLIILRKRVLIKNDVKIKQ